MGTKSANSVLSYQAVPTGRQVHTIGKQGEPPLEKCEPVTRLIRPHSKSVLSTGRATWSSRGHGPEFIKILWDDDQAFSTGDQSVDHPARDGAMRVAGVCKAYQHVGIQQNHSPSTRL